ncbi:DNA-binding response regulator [Chryseotalea sanaruensis]|uniref:DNA-binding response regulator n=1 Tax=Chryseotalea sanaruensis TaxID=2482724 RepID=A0A401U835_9BACT|nr:LytTR family DNA-binding domain-containing protein [Chryseotalea sanaruensis]GCC51049.1 DNA-binding response regulator [Chryseotalea sanaruensis]
MKILIAEDEPLASERLVRLLHLCADDFTILAQTDSVSETVSFLNEGNDPDLLLLDIQLADGKSFSILEQTKTDIPIIFTTAFDEYALKAFKFHSIDYLLKPIQQSELKAALEKFRRTKESKTNASIDILSLKKTLDDLNKKYKYRFVAKAGNKLVFIESTQVAFFYVEGKMVYAVAKTDGKKLLLDSTLDEVENLLDPLLFFRISRKFIVAASAISEVKGNVANMEVKPSVTTDMELTVSRERAAQFKQWLDQ